jgi:hypothetical protein
MWVSEMVRATTAKTVGRVTPMRAKRHASDPLSIVPPYGRDIRNEFSQRAQSNASKALALPALGPKNKGRNATAVMTVKLAPGSILKKWAGSRLAIGLWRVLIIANQMGVVTIGLSVSTPAIRPSSLGLLTTR